MGPWVWVACAAPEADPTVVPVPRAPSPVTIDGRPDEAAWNAASPSVLAAPWRPGGTRSRGEARLLWDERGLYAAGRFEDRDLRATITTPDGPVWDDDVFELYLAPDAGDGFYELDVNPLGARFDLWAPKAGPTDPAWIDDHTFHHDVAVALDGTTSAGDVDRGWTIEMFVPWTDLPALGLTPKPGDRARFTVCRYDWTGPTADLSCTAPLGAEDFHRTHEYVRFELRGRPK